MTPENSLPTPFSRLLRNFILIGRIEALSLLLLLFVAMPVKYLLGEPLAVRIVGSIHGVLFILYCVMAWLVSQGESRWSFGKLVWCLVLSSVPFGTFYFERKYLVSELIRPMSEQE